MILKSIIMLSAFVTFALPILHRLCLICAPRRIFYSSCFLFLLGKYSRLPPPPPPRLFRKWNNENNAYPKFGVRTRQERAIRQWWIAVKTEYYDKLCSVIMLLISRPCAYLHCNYIISRIPIYFLFGTISIYGRLTPRRKISWAFNDVTLTLFFSCVFHATAYLPLFSSSVVNIFLSSFL